MAKKKSKPIAKVFIDSSVLIAASISNKGKAHDLLLKGFQNELDLYISQEVVEESERNIKLKAPNSIEDFHIFKNSLEGKVVRTTKKQILKTAEVVHIKDAPIVAGAIKAKVAYLVSYDRKHLLQHKKDIESYFKLKAVTPDELI